MNILPQVSAFLSQHPIPNLIDGRDVSSPNVKPVFNPADASILTHVTWGGEKEIDLAADAAKRAFPVWASMPVAERAALLHRWADAMEKNAFALAQIETLDVGKAISASEAFDIPFGIEGLRYFANLSVNASYDTPLALRHIEARVHRSPFGVCGFIFPWNFPFDLLMWGVTPALAAGNTVVVKPSEVTPLSTLFAAKLALEAGIPPGVINVVVGNGPGAGAALTAHPAIRRMSFTGSPEAGAIVGEACGRRIIPCKLELGGKGAAVVFADADVEAAGTKLAAAITLNTGQVCCTATRWIVQESIYDQFVESARAALQATKIGIGLDRETQMGPLVSETQRERVLSYYERGIANGARPVLAAAKSLEPGYFVHPWLLEGDPDNVCFREEIFGPAAFLTKFRDESAAIEMIHSVDYGLANSVWTSDLAKANRFAEDMLVGNTWINAHNVFAYGLPYGGINRSGMGGGVNSPATFYDYLRDHTIARPL